MLSFTIGKSSISVFLDGTFSSIDDSHANYAPLLAELKRPADERDLTAIRTFITIKAMLEVLSIGRVTVNEDSILYDGQAVDNYMTQRMLELLSAGIDIAPWARFMDNVFLNPALYTRAELYEWMEKAKMPITPDGCFLAFKKVRADYTDCHTGKFDNSPGTVLEMDRASCDANRHNHCSSGFHFCSVGYLGSFGGQRVVVVKVNPKDITSIPSDYAFTKGRTCRYEVVAELTKESAAHNECWRKGIVNLENPAELPSEVIRNIVLPGPVLNEPVQAESDPIDIEEVEAACAAAEAEQTDAPVVEQSLGEILSESLVADASAKYVEAETGTLEELAIVDVEVVFTTSDGREFGADVIVAALADASIRGAAKNLGIQDSTLRGWKKKLGL